MDATKRQTLLTALRSLLTAIGSGVVTLGWANDHTVQLVIGAVMTIVPIAWEIYATFTSEQYTEDKVIDGVNAGLAHANDITPEGIVVEQVSDREAKNIAQAYEQNK